MCERVSLRSNGWPMLLPSSELVIISFVCSVIRAAGSGAPRPPVLVASARTRSSTFASQSGHTGAIQRLVLDGLEDAAVEGGSLL